MPEDLTTPLLEKKLFNKRQYREAIKHLELVCSQWHDMASAKILGKANMAIKNYDAAIWAYLMAFGERPDTVDDDIQLDLYNALLGVYEAAGYGDDTSICRRIIELIEARPRNGRRLPITEEELEPYRQLQELSAKRAPDIYINVPLPPENE